MSQHEPNLREESHANDRLPIHQLNPGIQYSLVLILNRQWVFHLPLEI